MKSDLYLILKATIFYIISSFSTTIISYLGYKTLGFSDDIFIFVTLILLFVSMFIGYFFSKSILEPLFERNRALDEFIKESLHELNVPIATISANIELLQKEQLSEKSVKRINRIELALKKLQKLYKELDYELKKEINRVEITVFDLKNLIENEILNFENQKNIEISMNLEGFFIKCDKEGFIKIFNNLIQNGIKYNKDFGFLKIELKNGLLTICDSGIGIGEDELIYIFERYYQGNIKNSGYGIGLSIVKNFCDDFGIGINIKSKKGVGTEISLNLKKLANQN